MFKRTNAVAGRAGLLIVGRRGSPPAAWWRAGRTAAAAGLEHGAGDPKFVEVVLTSSRSRRPRSRSRPGQPFVVHVMNQGAAQHTFGVSVNGTDYATPLLDPGGWRT